MNEFPKNCVYFYDAQKMVGSKICQTYWESLSALGLKKGGSIIFSIEMFLLFYISRSLKAKNITVYIENKIISSHRLRPIQFLAWWLFHKEFFPRTAHVGKVWPKKNLLTKELQNPWIDKYYVVQKRLATDFHAPKLGKGSSDYLNVAIKRRALVVLCQSKEKIQT